MLSFLSNLCTHYSATIITVVLCYILWTWDPSLDCWGPMYAGSSFSWFESECAMFSYLYQLDVLFLPVSPILWLHRCFLHLFLPVSFISMKTISTWSSQFGLKCIGNFGKIDHMVSHTCNLVEWKRIKSQRLTWAIKDILFQNKNKGLEVLVSSRALA